MSVPPEQKLKNAMAKIKVKYAQGQPKKGKKGGGKPQPVVIIQKSGKRQKRKKNRILPKGQRRMMSECARKYLACIAEPFSLRAAGACLPYPPDRDSLKVTSYARFSIGVDANGDNRIMFAPCLAKDARSLWYSANAAGVVPMTLAALNTAPANWAATSFTDLPFTTNDLGTSGTVSGRIVSVGIRMTYLGKSSDMEGVFYTWQDPAHNNINIAGNDVRTGATLLLGNSDVKVRRVSAGPHEMAFTVVSDKEHEYTGAASSVTGTAAAAPFNCRAHYPWSSGVDMNGSVPTSAGYVNNGAPCIIFGVSAGSGTYWVEVVQHVEYVGRGAVYGATASHNDHNAANTIQKAAETAHVETNAHPNKSWTSVVYDAFETANHVVQTPLGGAMASMAMRTAMSGLGRQVGALRLT